MLEVAGMGPRGRARRRFMAVVGLVGVREEGAEEGNGEVEADDWLWRPLKGNAKKKKIERQ